VKVEFIAVHCSATLPKATLGWQDIHKWHLERGFSKIGYHYVIRTNGTIEVGRMEHEDGAHVLGFNSRALGICLIGGVDEANAPSFNYTKAQMVSLATLCRGLLIRHPKAVLQGHRDFPAVAKACPSFDVGEWWRGVNP